MKSRLHSRTALASAIAMSLSAAPVQAATFYWDATPGVAGFGLASGTWSEPTDPALNAPVGVGWSTASNGAAATVIGTVATTTDEILNFGTATILGAGTVSVGTVSSGNLLFGGNTTGVVLAGGTITLSEASTLSVNFGNATNLITSNLAGGGTSLTKAGPGTLVLTGENTYTGRTAINAGRLIVRSIKPVGGGASTLGQPAMEDATISMGSLTAAANLTYIGTGDPTDRAINLAGTTGGAIIEHTGSGHLKFTSDFTATGSGFKTLTLQGLLSGTGEIAGAIPNSTANTALTKSGSVHWTLSGANTYTGVTTVNSGVLALAFGTVTTNIISADSALTLAGGTLQLAGTGSQAFSALTTTANTSSRIVLGANQTLNLGQLSLAGSRSSLNINTAAGGANASASTLGTAVVLLPGSTPGSTIASGFTVSDAGGIGLATVDASERVVRRTVGATLLPAVGSMPFDDYRIDNNAGGAAGAGSSSLTLTDLSEAQSLTVDTTAASGVLTLNPGVRFFNSMWHFGGSGSNTYQITGGADGAGLGSLAVGEAIHINNHNAAPVTFAAPILAEGVNAVNLNGPGTTIFSGSNTYTGRTTVNSGTLKINGGTSVIGTLFLGPAAFEMNGSDTSVTLSGSTEMNVGLSGASTFAVNDGTFLVQTASGAAANIGHGGDLTFNQTGGLFHFAPTGANKLLNIGVTFTGSATLNLSGGTFRTAPDVPAYLGGRVDTVMNLSGTAVADIPNLLLNRNLNTPHTATLNLGDGSPGSGLLKTNSIVRDSPTDHNIGIFHFNGGTLQAGAASESFMSKLTAATIKNGGAFIDTNGFDITISQPLLAFPGATTASLTKIGLGTLTLSGINQYSGNTVVSAGTLTLGNAQNPLNANPGNDASSISIASDATLNLTYTGTDKVAGLIIGGAPLADGVYGKSGSALPIIGISQITGDGTLTVGQSGFAAWIAGPFANGTIPADQQGPNDDFDKDGISNLIEYAVAGQDPTVPNSTLGTFSSNNLSFAKRTDATGISYRIEESSDLGIGDEWQEVAGPTYQNLAGVISYSLTPGSTARNFVRLRVTQAP